MKEQSFETLNEQIDPETDTLMNDSNIAASEEGDNLVEEDTEIDTDTMQNTEEVNDEESNAVDASGEKQEKSMKNFFKSNKNKEMTAKDQKIEELTDRLMRNMAEFDNFRKRSEKEKSQMYDIGAKSVIEKLLPIVDNFERGLGTVSEKEKGSAFAQGIELIYKQLVSALEEIGVKPIEAVGKEFDPALHNAVMHGEDENLGENIISDEFQKGYLYRDIVVRHSMVKVVN
ncbi:nucleotide exchange factor GrpE [Mobilitalea sibirica]|uniref:Protein GrpE n=1 Tax=Mobilitalea sibirica TaxID=1462919 RepID=A0A8J7H3R0_9FIRM|nr:nucleotide exchange factor GrpE [Mobilitalea sibirica]